MTGRCCAAAAVLLAAMSTAIAGPAPHQVSELLGRWHGTSICTKADWNAACHDEEALYDFVPGAAPGRLLLHAYKIVNRTPELMGDLDVSWDDTLHAWTAEFANERVHIRWSFEPHGDSLDGRLVMLPTLRVARLLKVSRQGPVPRP